MRTPINLLRNAIDEQSHNPSHLGVILNPLYLIRKELWHAVASQAPRLTGRVLDFGCGSKPYEGLFVNCESYVGVDIAQSGHNHNDSKVDVFWDGKTLPFDDNSFDACVSFEVFEHVFNPEAVLAELKRVLKPKGSLVITTPFVYGEHEVPFDFARYTSFGLRHLLSNAGFQVEDVEKLGDENLAIGQLLVDYVSNRVPKVKYFGFVLKALFTVPIIIVALVSSAVGRRKEDPPIYLNLLAVARK
jgi:SAM-dependent methyltransferase